MNTKFKKYYYKYFIVIMVIKIYTLYFYQSPILIGSRTGNRFDAPSQ